MKTAKTILITLTILLAIPTALKAAELATPPLQQPHGAVSAFRLFVCSAANVGSKTFPAGAIALRIFDGSGTRVHGQLNATPLDPLETLRVSRTGLTPADGPFRCVFNFGGSRGNIVASATACDTDTNAISSQKTSCVALPGQ